MPRIKPINKQKFTIHERYKEFLNRGTKSEDATSNPLNLFDDLNQRDLELLRSTKKYLKKAISSIRRGSNI